MSKLHWLAASSSLALLVFLSMPGCVQLDCGEGTIERDGVCVPSDSTPDPSGCGENTHLQDGECIADFNPTLCDLDTTEAQYDSDTGVTTCVGTGEGGGCAGSIVCTAPDAGKVTICGRIVDAETNAVVQVDGTSSARCEGPPTADGPCHIDIQFYDALEFAGDPEGASPLPNDEIVVDQCGRFRAVNLPSPAMGYIGIGVNDHPDAATDDYVLTGVAIPSSGGLQQKDLDVYIVARSTDEDWSTSAGDLGGSTFSEVGVFMPIYVNSQTGDPIEGVTIEGVSGPRPADDYYFTDSDPDSRTEVDGSLTATGANGTGLMLNSGLSDHSGTGPSGCTWPDNLAISLAGVVFAQEKLSLEETCGM